MITNYSQKPIFTIIVAMDGNRGIGIRNTLPWHLSDDLKRFKQLTTGHTIIMGKNTFNSLPKKPLPERKHIVLSTELIFEHPQVKIVSSIDKAIEASDLTNENFIIGGSKIYSIFLQYASKILITRISGSFETDTFFPELCNKQWEHTNSSEEFTDSKSGLKYKYETYFLKI